jgi:acyl-CoA-binding protein
MKKCVDRVFSHALNTVNKIRTGSQKPPSATRLRLYGLYKQAMGTLGCRRGGVGAKMAIEETEC